MYLNELAEFLRITPARLRRWFEDRGIMHWQGLGCGYSPVGYVSEHAAMRAIAHFRAIQGEPGEKGLRIFQRLRKHERNRALKGDRFPTNGGLSPQLPIANPRADTEDEP